MTILDGDKLADSMHYKLCNDIACFECSFLLEDGKCKVEKWLDEAPTAAGLHEECYELPNGADITFQYDDNGIGMVTLTAMDMLVDMINKKPKQGEWEEVPYKRQGHDEVIVDGTSWRCTNCGSVEKRNEPNMNFCPNCGAKMQGESMRLYERVTDDITNCTANCMVDCKRQPRYILDKTIPHSFADFSESCGEYEADGYWEGADDDSDNI